MLKRIYPLLYVLVAGALVTAAYALRSAAKDTVVILPLTFTTVYYGFRTIMALLLFVFFVILVIRHVILLLFSFADQIERALDERRRRKRTTPPFCPPVSIIAPAFNEGPCIEASIRSLVALDYPRYEVIVVDDGSSDDTLERARKLEGEYGNATVVVLWKPNGGKASALNWGIQRATSDFVMTMDSDSVLRKDTLREAVKYFEDAAVGAVAGSVAVVNHGVSFWSKLQHLEYIKGLNFVRRAQGFLRAVSIVPGPIGLFRRSAIAKVGYYAEDTFAEDCDLTLKLLLAGWKICYEPLAEAQTEAPEELIPLIKQRYRWTRGILQAIRKHRLSLLGIRTPIIATIMLWYMVFEALVWPVMTGVSVVFIVLSGADAAIRPAAAFFWIMLLLLELSTTLYCITIEERPFRLLAYAPVERLVFSLLLDVCRILASMEEFLGLRMSWGKLDRKGRT